MRCGRWPNQQELDCTNAKGSGTAAPFLVGPGVVRTTWWRARSLVLSQATEHNPGREHKGVISIVPRSTNTLVHHKSIAALNS